MLHMTNAYAVPAGLRRLNPEPWGSRLIRARETSRFSPTQGKAAEWISRATSRPISSATISRLESRDTLPPDRSRRATAYLLCLLYELDPADLDLSPDDGPNELEVRRLHNAVTALATLGYVGHPAFASAGNYLVAA